MGTAGTINAGQEFEVTIAVVNFRSDRDDLIFHFVFPNSRWLRYRLTHRSFSARGFCIKMLKEHSKSPIKSQHIFARWAIASTNEAQALTACFVDAVSEVFIQVCTV